MNVLTCSYNTQEEVRVGRAGMSGYNRITN